MDNWIVETIRQRYRRQLTAWVGVIAALICLGYSQSRYITNFVQGPYSLNAVDLNAIHDVSATPHYFVTVAGSKAIPTGLQKVTVRRRAGIETGRTVEGYFALVVDDRLLICKSSAGPGTTYTGALAPIPSEVSTKLFDTAEMRAMQDRFYPFYLDDHSFRRPGYVAIAGLLVLAFFLIRQTNKARSFLSDPSSHPVAKRVKEWGDLGAVAEEVRRDIASPRFNPSGGWLIGNDYLVRTSFFTFDLLRLNDLLWAYKRVTKRSVNFIPTGKTFEAVFLCCGGEATVAGKETFTDDLLTFAAQRTPWAIFGYTEELSDRISKNPLELLVAVELRKRDWMQKDQPPHKNERELS